MKNSSPLYEVLRVKSQVFVFNDITIIALFNVWRQK